MTSSRTVRSKLLGRIGIGVAVFLLLLLALYAFIPASIFKGPITSAIRSSTGRSAQISGPMEFHRWSLSPALVIHGLKVANPTWARHPLMLDVESIRVSVHLPHLLRGEVLIPGLEITRPLIALERTPDGRASWEPDTGPKTPPGKPTQMPVIRRLILTHGGLDISDGVRKLSFDGAITVDENAAAENGTGFFMNGTGKLNDKAFKMTVKGAPLLNVQRSRPYTFDAEIIAGDLHLSASNTIEHPFDLAQVRSKFAISGKDLANVYYLTGLALPNTPPFSLAGTVQRRDALFSVDDFEGRLGNSDIRGHLDVQTDRERPKLSARLRSRRLDLGDLAAPLGAGPKSSDELSASKPHATPSPASASQEPAKPTVKAAPKTAPPSGSGVKAEGLLLPDANLIVDRVRGMDADVTYEAGSVLAEKLPLKNVSFHLLLDNGLLQLKPVNFVLPQGKLAGNVAIDARKNTPVTQMDWRISEVDLSQFKPKSMTTPPLGGTLLGRIQLKGAGASVHKFASTADGDISIIIPHGEMRSAFAELTGINLDRGLGLLLAKSEKPAAIRCGVIHLQSASGVMDGKTIVVDTENVLISAKGNLNLRDESMDLELRGQPKHVRLVRLRSPITIGGTLSNPKIGLQAQSLLAQAGAATALGILLTPVAAVIAFVDPGLAKDANCAAVIADAASHQ